MNDLSNLDNLEIIKGQLPNRVNAAYHVIRSGEIQEPVNDCSHDWEQYTQDKKWGSVDWLVCLTCGGVKQGRIEDISVSGIARQRQIDYQTEHAGHPRGAKIEQGNSTMIGRDYERQ